MIDPSLLLPRFIRRRVGLQLVVVCGSVLAVAAVVSGTYTAESQKTVVLAEVERQGQMLVNALAMCCPVPLLSNDVPALRLYVDSLVDNDRVIWAEIVREDGKTVATNGIHSSEGRRYSAPVLLPDDFGAIPPGAPRLGMVHVELSTTHANLVAAASSRQLLNQWGMTFFALSISLGLVFRFLIHGRLDRLARQAIRLGGGDLETSIVLGAPDEFGQLASILDNVRCRLRASYRDLQERNVQLQALDKLKSEFLANVSHEIRTPLNGILGFSELLLHRDLEPETSEVIETIFTSARSLRSIVDDVLEFSKLEAGEVRIVPEVVELRTLLADVAHLYAPAAWQKGVELVLDVHPAVPGRMMVDPLRVRQIVSNLLSNAVKFTERGEVVVCAEIVDAAEPHARLRLSVTDTGVGFDPAQSGRLFQSFRQLDGSQSRRHGGTGLGLAIARHLVERMAGSIHAESQPGVGSRFWLEVPLVPAPAVDTATADGALVDGACRDDVVVVSARESLRRALAHELQAQRHPCQVYATLPTVGAVAAPATILFVVEGAPDTYAEQAMALRALLPTPAPRLVAVVPPGASVQASDLGVDHVLQRPVRSDRLQGALAGVSRERDSRRRPLATAQLKARVLVVDDNAVNCRVAEAMLKRLGHEVVVAPGGREAVAALEGGAEFDVILMDCQMPDVDGFEATRQIRALSSPSAAIPIIACTANNLAGDAERCLAAGMDDYMPKPIELTKLRNAIEKWMGVVADPKPAG